MAQGSVTSTGIDEMRGMIRQLPDVVTLALSNVARETANRQLATARRLLRSQLKTPASALIEGIEVRKDLDRKMYLVESIPPIGQPANITIWNEYGTIYMLARPYMRPANDMERERYRADMERISANAVRDLFKSP